LFRKSGILRRHPERTGVRLGSLSCRSCNHETAKTKLQIKGFKNMPTLLQNQVKPHNAEICAPVLNVSQDICSADHQDPKFAIGRIKRQFPGL
jgi:hypothetical protein